MGIIELGSVKQLNSTALPIPDGQEQFAGKIRSFGMGSSIRFAFLSHAFASRIDLQVHASTRSKSTRRVRVARRVAFV